ncbi:MAG: hypothetical protein Q7U78_03295 [Gallionella sp.]|nr:hypothetical protein [Gallionella sp.]
MTEQESACRIQYHRILFESKPMPAKITRLLLASRINRNAVYLFACHAQTLPYSIQVQLFNSGNSSC